MHVFDGVRPPNLLFCWGQGVSGPDKCTCQTVSKSVKRFLSRAHTCDDGRRQTDHKYGEMCENWRNRLRCNKRFCLTIRARLQMVPCIPSIRSTVFTRSNLNIRLLRMQVKSLKKKLEEVTKDNEDLLCAVKYLKSKMEQKDASSRCATPTVEARSIQPFSRDAHHPHTTSSSSSGLLASVEHETRTLRDKCTALERENARLRIRATSEGCISTPMTLNDPEPPKYKTFVIFAICG